MSCVLGEMALYIVRLLLSPGALWSCSEIVVSACLFFVFDLKMLSFISFAPYEQSICKHNHVLQGFVSTFVHLLVHSQVQIHERCELRLHRHHNCIDNVYAGTFHHLHESATHRRITTYEDVALPAIPVSAVVFDSSASAVWRRTRI